MRSLRSQLIFFWIILLTVCCGLAIVMLVLFRSSAGAQIETVRASAEQACSSIAERYTKSLGDPHQEKPQLDLLQVLLQLVLIELPRVEGGVWQSDHGFLAYAYPTYEGSGAKRDIPAAEQPHIMQIAQIVARTQRPQTDVVRASREALVVSACPLQSPHKDLVAWTMTRTSGSTLDAMRSLRVGLGILFAFVFISGVWLGSILWRAYRHVQRIESRLAEENAETTAQPMILTGVKELDRIVIAANLSRSRFEQTRAKLQEAERQRARDQRLTVLGRMTGGVAHEIRTPIATMRLKAENALAGPPEKQAPALALILEQIDRLDGLVQSLLAIVQPINLHLTQVEPASWLNERVAAIRPRAELRQVLVEVEIEVEPTLMEIDEIHLTRALDNLLDNAVRHARSTVKASLGRCSKESWFVRVDDDGQGVSQSIRDQIFEPFASGRPDGTGLGLAMAREVALAHGGDLSYIEKPHGTRFEMELPWRAS